jgi:hypothetical protein
VKNQRRYQKIICRTSERSGQKRYANFRSQVAKVEQHPQGRGGLAAKCVHPAITPAQLESTILFLGNDSISRPQQVGRQRQPRPPQPQHDHTPQQR